MSQPKKANVHTHHHQQSGSAKQRPVRGRILYEHADQADERRTNVLAVAERLLAVSQACKTLAEWAKDMTMSIL